jgi:hypothetical protein
MTANYQMWVDMSCKQAMCLVSMGLGGRQKNLRRRCGLISTPSMMMAWASSDIMAAFNFTAADFIGNKVKVSLLIITTSIQLSTQKNDATPRPAIQLAVGPTISRCIFLMNFS